MFDNIRILLGVFNKNCDKLMKKASLLSEKGEYDKAIEIYKKIIDINNSYVSCYTHISTCFMALNDYKSALEYINLAILNNPKFEDNYYQKTNILIGLERFDDCIKTMEKLEKFMPEAKELNFFYALGYEFKEDYNKALLYINKQLLKEKDDCNYRVKIRCLYNLQRYDEAVAIARKALELGDDADTYYWLAACYHKIDEKSEALKAINKAILLDSNSKYNFYIKYEIHLSLGDKVAAQKAYDKAVELGYED